MEKLTLSALSGCVVQVEVARHSFIEPLCLKVGLSDSAAEEMLAVVLKVSHLHNQETSRWGGFITNCKKLALAANLKRSTSSSEVGRESAKECKVPSIK